MKNEKIVLIILILLVLGTTLFNAKIGLMTSIIAMVIYIPIYFYSKDTGIKKSKIWAIITISILIAIMIVANIRFFSGEDGWMCNNGQWIKHGNPSTSMPSEPCL